MMRVEHEEHLVEHGRKGSCFVRGEHVSIRRWYEHRNSVTPGRYEVVIRNSPQDLVLGSGHVNDSGTFHFDNDALDDAITNATSNLQLLNRLFP
jgi:hypothetical protein